jgi:hypothetical protein
MMVSLPSFTGDPAPAGAELGDTRLDEVGAHLVIAAEVRIDRGLQAPRNLLAAAIGLHPAPEVDVIVMLAHIVDERRILLGEAALQISSMDLSASGLSFSALLPLVT